MKPREANLTHDELTRILDYNPETGVFVWKAKIADKVSCRRKLPAFLTMDMSELASSAISTWRIVLRGSTSMVNGRARKLTISIWNRSDNRICNLARATKQQNCRNRKAQSNNKLGLKGVCEHKQQPGKFTAQIGENGKKRHLGIFTCPI